MLVGDEDVFWTFLKFLADVSSDGLQLSWGRAQKVDMVTGGQVVQGAHHYAIC